MRNTIMMSRVAVWRCSK